jgi:hypothetical protein
MRSFVFYIKPKYYYADQINENVARMGGECVQGFDGKARRKETTWKTKA